jgi:argininosuccinate synthase
MLIFNRIVDVLLIAGTLWVVWGLAQAAKMLAEPDATAKEILAAAKQMQISSEQLKAQIVKLSFEHGVPPDCDEKFDAGIEGGY